MAKPRKDPVYIVPHFSGLAYAAFVVVVFIFGSLSGQSSTAIQTAGICLLVAGIVVLVQSNENLRMVSVESLEDVVAPAGEPSEVPVLLNNRGSEEAIGLRVRFARSLPVVSLPVAPPSQSTRVSLLLPPAPRGVRTLPKVGISSTQPAGLCFVWKTYPQPARCFSYPKPSGIPLASMTGKNPAGEGNHPAGGDDVAGHRGYSPGDPVNRIDWAAYARRREAVVRALAAGDGGLVTRLRWEDTDFLHDTGDRLAQLSLWAEECSHAGSSFIVEWPGGELTAGLTATRRAMAAFPAIAEASPAATARSRS